MTPTRPLSLPAIWNMSFGFLGIQFGWGLQMANMSAIYQYLGAREDEIAILLIVAPVLEAGRDELRRVLEVGVEDRDDLAARPREARRHGRLVAEVAREADDPEAGLGRRHDDELLVGAVD